MSFLREETRNFITIVFSLTQVNLEIQCHLKEAETRDINHVDILGRVDYMFDSIQEI